MKNKLLALLGFISLGCTLQPEIKKSVELPILVGMNIISQNEICIDYDTDKDDNSDLRYCYYFKSNSNTIYFSKPFLKLEDKNRDGEFEDEEPEPLDYELNTKKI